MFPAGTPQAHGVVWKWQEKGHWLCYDNVSNVILERHYFQNAASVDMSRLHPNMPYCINLRTMEQFNIHTRYKRKVQRVPLPCPYPPATEKDLANVHPSLNAVRVKSVSQRKRKNHNRDVGLGMQSLAVPSESPELSASSHHQWLAHCKVVYNLGSESEKEVWPFS